MESNYKLKWDGRRIPDEQFGFKSTGWQNQIYSKLTSNKKRATWQSTFCVTFAQADLCRHRATQNVDMACFPLSFPGLGMTTRMTLPCFEASRGEESMLGCQLQGSTCKTLTGYWIKTLSHHDTKKLPWEFCQREVASNASGYLLRKNCKERHCCCWLGEQKM